MTTELALGQVLRTAAKAGNLQGVREALTDGADVDSASLETGRTAVHHAVDGLHYDVVKLLLSTGADVNARDAKGQTPLHIAAHGNGSRMIELLIDADADLSLVDKSGRTPFNVAHEEHKEDASDALSTTSGARRGMIFGHTRTGLNETSGLGEDARAQKEIAEGEKELREAAMDGDVAGVEEALRVYPGIDIEAFDPQGLTTLYLSVMEGQTDVAEVLLEHGARVDVVGTNEHWTPVHWAAVEGAVKLVEILVVSDPSVINKTDKMGRTPLILASENGHMEVVRILLEFDADCTIVDSDGTSPLLVASASNHVEVVKALLSAPKTSLSELQIDRANRDGETALHEAALKGNHEVAILLLDAGADKEAVNKVGATPLLSATANSQFKMVSLLIDHGANPNAANSSWQTPLYIASVDGHVNIVRELLQHDATTETSLENGMTPLMAASREGRIGIIAELLANGADIGAADNSGATPLLIAAKEGYSNVVGFLLHNGANISETDSEGFTALHIAAADGHVGVLRICLSVLHGEAVSNQGWLSSLGHLRADTRGETALHLGARHGHTAIVQELLSYDAQAQQLSEGLVSRPIFGAMVNLPNKFGWGPLHVAVDRSQLSVIDLLIRFDANVNAPDLFGNTPVHLAARLEDPLVMEKLLLVPDVDVASVNRDGEGMLHFSSSCVRPRTLSMLLDAGVDPHAQDKKARKPYDVLNIMEECNPPDVEQSEIYDTLEVNNASICLGDMCPVQLGTANDILEANSLLKAAMNTSTDHSGVRHVATHFSMGGSGSGLIGTPLVVSLTPVAFLILIFTLVYAFRRKIINGRRHISCQLDKRSPRCSSRGCEPCVNAENCNAKPCIPTLFSLKSMPRDESPMDQVDRSIFSGDHGLFEQVLTSLDCSSLADIPDWNSETSSDAGTCGWSETSSDGPAPSGQLCSQCPQGSTSQQNEKFFYGVRSGGLDSMD